MNTWMTRFRSPAFWVGILGGAKLITSAFGIEWITDEQINVIANGAAAVAVIVGTFVGYKEG